MNEFVLDANIIFSSLLSGKGFYRRIFGNNKFYSSEIAFLEIKKYQHVILSKTKMNTRELQEFTLFIFSNIIFIPDYYISEKSKKRAYKLCAEIDEKDIPYLALSIELDKTLITRDKPLYNGLKDKGYKNIILFEEFLKGLHIF